MYYLYEIDMAYKHKKGKFKPTNPKKYKGDVANIIYRSGWECRLMDYFDKHPEIVMWVSEEIAIPYMSPIDNRIHRYFPDFLIQKQDHTGRLKTILIEVKPHEQTLKPSINTKGGRRKANRIITEQVKTYSVNQAKWRAAKEWAADRKIDFIIMTEHHIFGKKNG